MKLEQNEVHIIHDALNVYIECTEEMLKDQTISEVDRGIAHLGLALAKHTLAIVHEEVKSFSDQPTFQ